MKKNRKESAAKAAKRSQKMKESHENEIRDSNLRNDIETSIELSSPKDTEISGFAYAMHSVEAPNLVKLGYANDVELRRRQLQVGNPFELKTIWKAKFPDKRAAEKFLHTEFGSSRVRGEWFDFGLISSSELIRLYLCTVYASMFPGTVGGIFQSQMMGVRQVIEDTENLFAIFNYDSTLIVLSVKRAFITFFREARERSRSALSDKTTRVYNVETKEFSK